MSEPPAVTVILPRPLRALFADAPETATLRAWTVDDLFDELDRRWPGMRHCLADTRPAVRRHINVFVAGERADLTTPLPPGAEVYVLTAMSGG